MGYIPDNLVTWHERIVFYSIIISHSLDVSVAQAAVCDRYPHIVHFHFLWVIDKWFKWLTHCHGCISKDSRSRHFLFLPSLPFIIPKLFLIYTIQQYHASSRIFICRISLRVVPPTTGNTQSDILINLECIEPEQRKQYTNALRQEIRT